MGKQWSNEKEDKALGWGVAREKGIEGKNRSATCKSRREEGRQGGEGNRKKRSKIYHI